MITHFAPNLLHVNAKKSLQRYNFATSNSSFMGVFCGVFACFSTFFFQFARISPIFLSLSINFL